MQTLKEASKRTDAQKIRAVKNTAKAKKSTEKFLRTRMWFSTLLSLVYNDGGTIPENIGNNINILNNMYVTKNSLNAIIIVRELSTDTPLSVISDMITTVKRKVPDIRIDVTIKNKKAYINTSSSDMRSRVAGWEKTLSNPMTTDAHKRRAARLLYSLDIIRSGETIYNSAIFITIRAAKGNELNRGVEQVENYLQKIGCLYKVVKSDIKSVMEYSLAMSDKVQKKNKDIPKNLQSAQTLAEMLPVTQGYNDTTGSLLGIDREANTGYFINFRASAKAKNIFIVATSGAGKTMLAQTWFLDMYADNYNMCIMDIKGTEFVGFTRAAGGIVISLKPDSTFYVNTFMLDPREAKEDFGVYYDERLSLSKKVMLLLSSLPEGLEPEGEALLEEFLVSMYMNLGVSADNPNSWYRTKDLTPYDVYTQFERYLSTDILSKYRDVGKRMLSRLTIYMSKNGSNSHMFRDPLNYKDIMDNKVICFNFGILDASQNTDVAMFKVKALYMTIIKEKFVSHKASLGEWTGAVLEESGLAEDYLLKLYSNDFKMRRSQNQVTILLGNSVSALAENKSANGILENINILVAGMLHKTSREYLINEYGLEDYADKLELIQTNPEYENTFLLINRMEKDATNPMLKAYIPQGVVDGKLFRVVDTEVS